MQIHCEFSLANDYEMASAVYFNSKILTTNVLRCTYSLNWVVAFSDGGVAE